MAEIAGLDTEGLNRRVGHYLAQRFCAEQRTKEERVTSNQRRSGFVLAKESTQEYKTAIASCENLHQPRFQITHDRHRVGPINQSINLYSPMQLQANNKKCYRLRSIKERRADYGIHGGTQAYRSWQQLAINERIIMVHVRKLM